MLKPIEEYEAAFIDFDDTLCVRLVHEDEQTFYEKIFSGDTKYYLNENAFRPGVGCERLLERLKATFVYCLTLATSDIVRVPKQAFLDYHFAGYISDMIIVGTREEKVRLMEQFAKVYGLKHEDILLVDDHPETRSEALSKGFDVMSASEVAIRYGGLYEV